MQACVGLSPLANPPKQSCGLSERGRERERGGGGGGRPGPAIRYAGPGLAGPGASIQVLTCDCIFTCSHTFTTHTGVRAHTRKGAKALPQNPPLDIASMRAGAEGAEPKIQQPEVHTKQDCDAPTASSTSSQHAVRPLRQTTGLSVNIMRALYAFLSSSMPTPLFTPNPYLLLLPILTSVSITFCL